MVNRRRSVHCYLKDFWCYMFFVRSPPPKKNTYGCTRYRTDLYSEHLRAMFSVGTALFNSKHVDPDGNPPFN